MVAAAWPDAAAGVPVRFARDLVLVSRNEFVGSDLIIEFSTKMSIA